MRSFATGCLVGCALLWVQSELLSTVSLVLMLSGSVLLRSLCKRYCPELTDISRFLLGLAVGLLWSGLYAQQQLSHRMPQFNERKDVMLTGEVCSNPNKNTHSIRFNFCLDSSNEKAGTAQPRKIILSWYYAEQSPQFGERWRFQARLKTPYSRLNPGSFDFERWSLIEGIDATGYVQQGELISTELPWSLDRLRHDLIRRLSSATESSLYPGWHLALTVGHRSLLSEEQVALLKESGTAHLIAISGLHVGLVFMWSYWCVSWLWRRSVGLCQKVPANTVAILSGFIIALVFSFMAGFDLPTQRAMIALLVVTFSQVSLVRWSHFSMLCVTVLLMLMFDPLSVLSEGFWLTLTALCIIYWLLGQKQQRGLAFWIKLQLFLSLGMSAVSSIFFGVFSINAILSNLIAIPLVSFLILPLDLLAYLSSLVSRDLSALVFSISDYPIDFLNLVFAKNNEWFAALKISRAVSLWVLVSVLSLYLCWVIRHALLISGCCINLLLLSGLLWTAEQEQSMVVYFLDVGQSQSIVINHQETWIVYDTGFAGHGYSSAKSTLAPFLSYKGVEQLDLLVLSHKDIDHTGDFEFIIREFQPDKVIFGEKTQGHQSNCRRQKLNLGELEISFWSASESRETQQGSNNLSCVVHVEVDNQTVLLTGDIELLSEKKLATQAEFELTADLMSVPHHGSKTSSSWSFLAEVDARVAVANSGYLNRFNHPAESVSARYEALNIQLYNTGLEGLIKVSWSQAGTIEVKAYRKESGKFWNH